MLLLKFIKSLITSVFKLPGIFLINTTIVPEFVYVLIFAVPDVEEPPF